MSVQVTLSDGLAAAVDGVRGDVPRADWVARAVSSAVDASLEAAFMVQTGELSDPESSCVDRADALRSKP